MSFFSTPGGTAGGAFGAFTFTCGLTGRTGFVGLVACFGFGSWTGRRRVGVACWGIGFTGFAAC
jgi:hypothetical protein